MKVYTRYWLYNTLMDMNIILASTSFRRQEMLKWLGIPFDIVASNFPEENVKFEDFMQDGFEDPEGYVTTIAQGKALTVLDEHPLDLIIASDTMVYLDGVMYGKPKDLDDAREMLKKLRGKTHAVYTAVVMVYGKIGEWRKEVVKTEVTFFDFSDEALEKYINTSEPYDKAGGYAFQGVAKQFVKDVKGSVTNVIGFPLLVVRDMLEEFGVQVDVNLEESIFQKMGYRS